MSDCGISAAVAKDPVCPKCGAALTGDATPLANVGCAACGEIVMMPGMLGQYRLIRLIGQGGMGAVYEGFDEGLHRKVAVKVILREKAAEDPEFIANFQREAQSAARLNSTNIVGIYAFGESEGQPYLVMELVQPNSLDRMMKDGPVQAVTVLSVGRQIALGLKAASEQGLVHGDVKPENILINEAHEAKLADFGIAALMGAHAASANEVWGTPYYIAPETLRKQKVDLRADIYSLGATLYHAIAGVPPFEGEDAVEVMKGRLLGPARPLLEVAPHCPEEISKIIMRMLEAEPIRRYPNYDSLVADMDKKLRGAKSVIGGGKRIVVKGKSVTQAVPSRPMPSVENLNAPLTPPKKQGMSKGKIIALAAGLGCGVPLVIAIILGIVLVTATKNAVEEVADQMETAVAEAQTVDPAAAQAQIDLKALVELSETIAAENAELTAWKDSATAILKQLANQAKRAVLPDQESWLEPMEGEAPTSMLKELQKAYGRRTQLETAASAMDALRAKVDGARANAEANEAEATALLAEVNAAVEAYRKTPEAAAAKSNLDALESLKAGWRRVVDRARVEMDAAVQARFEAEKKAKAEAAAAEAAEKARREIEEEVASVETIALALGDDLDRFMPEAAASGFKTRVARLKSAEAKAASEKIGVRIAAYQRLKDWLIAEAKAGKLAAYKITAADKDRVTIAGKKMMWKDFVAEKQMVAFQILRNSIADETGSKGVRISERAALAVSARLFVNHYFGEGMLEKSKALRDVMDKLADIAEALPASRNEMALLEGEKTEEPASEETAATDEAVAEETAESTETSGEEDSSGDDGWDF